LSEPYVDMLILQYNIRCRSLKSQGLDLLRLEKLLRNQFTATICRRRWGNMKTTPKHREARPLAALSSISQNWAM